MQYLTTQTHDSRNSQINDGLGTFSEIVVEIINKTSTKASKYSLHLFSRCSDPLTMDLFLTFQKNPSKELSKFDSLSNQFSHNSWLTLKYT